MRWSKILLGVGILSLLISAVCNGILAVAARRAGKNPLYMYTDDLQMNHKRLVMVILLASVVIGIGGVVTSIVIGRSEASSPRD